MIPIVIISDIYLIDSIDIEVAEQGVSHGGRRSGQGEEHRLGLHLFDFDVVDSIGSIWGSIEQLLSSI